MDDRAERSVPEGGIRHPQLYVLLMLGGTLTALSTASAGGFFALSVVPLARLLPRPARRARLLRRFVSILPMALPAVVLRAAWTRGTTPVSLLGSFATREALGAGTAIGLRIAVATLFTSWLTESLSPAQIDHALLRLGVPRTLLDLLLLTRRFAQQLRATLSAAWTAAALRGGFSSVRTLSTTAGSLAGILVVRALERSERVATSLALRGHGGSLEAEPVDRFRDARFLGFVLATLALAVWLGGRP